MTNAAIVAMHTARLIEEGIIPEDSAIHTYAHWMMEYKLYVKHGEKHIAKFPIHKYTDNKRDKDRTAEEEEELQRNGHFFLKDACWFSREQVCTRDEYKELFGFYPEEKKKAVRRNK